MVSLRHALRSPELSVVRLIFITEFFRSLAKHLFEKVSYRTFGDMGLNDFFECPFRKQPDRESRPSISCS